MGPTESLMVVCWCRLPVYISGASSPSEPGGMDGVRASAFVSGTAFSVNEGVKALVLVAAGKASLANKLLRAAESDVDRNRGTTKVFEAGFGDVAELSEP